MILRSKRTKQYKKRRKRIWKYRKMRICKKCNKYVAMENLRICGNCYKELPKETQKDLNEESLERTTNNRKENLLKWQTQQQQ